MFRRFKQQFKYTNDDGQRITIPFNWAGELPAAVAKQADEAGATVAPTPEKPVSQTSKKSDDKK